MDIFLDQGWRHHVHFITEISFTKHVQCTLYSVHCTHKLPCKIIKLFGIACFSLIFPCPELHIDTVEVILSDWRDTGAGRRRKVTELLGVHLFWHTLSEALCADANKWLTREKFCTVTATGSTGT